MTPQLLYALKEYICAVAQYEAARTTDDEASWAALRQAEKELDEEFARETGEKQ